MDTKPFEPFQLTGADGDVLHGYFLLPAKTAPRAVIQICHGLAEHARRYDRFAAALADAGFGTYAIDLPGHGPHAARAGSLGTFACNKGVERIISGQMALRRHMAEHHPSTFMVLIGHSLGALIAANMMLRYPGAHDAALLMNTDFHGGSQRVIGKLALSIERILRGDKAPSWFAPQVTFAAWNRRFRPTRTPFDWLSRDPAEVDKYVADPLCGWDPSISMWHDVAQLVDFTADDRNLVRGDKTLPIHLISGTQEFSSNRGEATTAFADRLRAAGYGRVITRIYAGARHETLNDTHRDQATADIIVWINGLLEQS